MSDLGSRDLLLLPHSQDRNTLMQAGLRSPNPDPKEEIATFVAGLGIGQIAALRGYKTRVRLQLECSAPSTLREAKVFPWQRDVVFHSHPEEAAEALFRRLAGVEDVGPATEEWPTCML